MIIFLLLFMSIFSCTSHAMQHQFSLQEHWTSTNPAFKRDCKSGIQDLTKEQLENFITGWKSIVDRAKKKESETSLQDLQPKFSRLFEKHFSQVSLSLLSFPLHDNNLIQITARAYQLGLKPLQIETLQKILIALFEVDGKNFYEDLRNLKIALFNGNEKQVAQAIEQGVPVNGIVTKFGLTALMIAVKNNHTKTAQVLLERPELDVNAQDPKKDFAGWTALHHAIRIGNLKMCALILKHPTLDIDLQNARGESAIMLAARLDQKEILNTILKKIPKVNLDLINKRGQRTIDLAVTKKTRKILIDHYHHQKYIL